VCVRACVRACAGSQGQFPSIAAYVEKRRNAGRGSGTGITEPFRDENRKVAIVYFGWRRCRAAHSPRDGEGEGECAKTGIIGD
jgi:hypothetical protein